MIVVHRKTGWKIISHYTHGLFAGKLAEQLKLDFRPEQWLDTLTAIIEHDDYLLDFGEQDYLTEIGMPLDYRMAGETDEEAYEHAERVYRNATQKSQFTAMLVGHHLDFLYSELAEAYKPLKKFLKNVREERVKQRNLYGLDKEAASTVYDLMRFCDRCSLILCQDQVPTLGRKLEINAALGDIPHFISKGGEDSISVSPWPFEKQKFSLNFEYRLLLKSDFKDNDELEAELKAVKVHLQEIQFEK
ncbi:DUF3891 family protein [Pricia sp. S334]|uniref:DUF3891 family protein n=1 Tax=Pricia mediterranea TaxID=3076079 RepID=A0ABU3L1J4_9FLAO|nr:DUF3891 family protein [Pricia sp. S334]MDT7827587.1 DUF3891 family protein [Pricia sp. S334]